MAGGIGGVGGGGSLAAALERSQRSSSRQAVARPTPQERTQRELQRIGGSQAGASALKQSSTVRAPSPSSEPILPPSESPVTSSNQPPRRSIDVVA